MKIAIVGAGFYGCYFARAIEKRWGVRVDLYDRESKPMSRAAQKNQSRLHLGFHYPRATDTIAQTVRGYLEFIKEFESCIKFPSRNLYAVSSEGLIKFKDYLSAMDMFGLKYDNCGDEYLHYFKSPSLIEGVIRVDEGVIDLKKLKEKMLIELRSKIYCSALVSRIDAESGLLVVNGNVTGPYDFVINTTYVEPNMGLPENKRFKLKYELAAMVVMDAPFGESVALTIMDGPFVSLYPCGQGRATLSSVVHTPFAKYDSVEELESAYRQANMLAERLKVKEKILNHGTLKFSTFAFV